MDTAPTVDAAQDVDAAQAQQTPIIDRLPTYSPNPNLSRDVLGLVFSEYRKNLEHSIRKAPVKTLDGEVPSCIAADAMRRFISFNLCNEPECNGYCVYLHKRDSLELITHNDEMFDEFVKYGDECHGCGKWFCAKHLYDLDTPNEDGRGLCCIGCCREYGCYKCYKNNPTGAACVGYENALDYMEANDIYGTYVYTCDRV